jgi:hypothetical protein
MADEITVLDAKVRIDASSARAAKSEYDTAIDGMAQTTRRSFAEIKAETDRLISKSDELAARRKESIQKIQDAEQGMAQSSKTIGQQIQASWGEIVGASATIVGAIAAAEKAFDVLEKAAQFRALTSATQNMARAFGVDMDTIMAKLDAVSNRTMTQTDKMRLFNRALIALGTEGISQLPQLYEIANAIAIARNESTEASFERLFTGIERGSSKMVNTILPNALKVNDVVKQYADANGIAVDAVDELTAKQLMLNEVTEKGGALVGIIGKNVGDEVDAFHRLEKATGELGATLAQMPFVTGTVIEGLTTAVNAASQLVAILASAVAGGFQLAILAAQLHAEIKIAGVGVGVGNKNLKDVVAGANRAFEETFKRMTAAQGIQYGETDERRQAILSMRRSAQEGGVSGDTTLKDKQLKAEREFQDKRAQAIIDGGQKAREAEQSMLQDMEDLEIDHYNKLSEIAIDGARKRQDISIDYGRKVEDAETDYQQAVEDNQSDHRNRMVDIEQKYQEKIRQVQRRFTDEYWNAVKNRDAVALVEAVRNRNRGIEDANYQRDVDTTNEDAANEEKNQKAQENYQRKLADADKYYRRAMEDQRLAQSRAAEDEMRDHAIKEAELTRHYEWRRIAIVNALTTEIAEMNIKYSQSEADYSAHLARMAALAQAYLGVDLGAGSAYGGGPSRRTRKTYGQGYAQGGIDLVNSPTQFTAGEGNTPELVMVMPLGGQQNILPAPAMSHLVSGNVSHQVDMITANGMRGMEGRIIAAVVQSLREVYRR